MVGTPILSFPDGVVGLGKVVAKALGIAQPLPPCPSYPVPSLTACIPCLPLGALAPQAAPTVMSYLCRLLVSHQRVCWALGVIFLGQSDLVALVLPAVRRLAGDTKLPLSPAALGVCGGLRVVAEAQGAPGRKPVKDWWSSGRVKGSKPGSLSHRTVTLCVQEADELRVVRGRENRSGNA